MAALVPNRQSVDDQRDGTSILVTEVTLVTTSDTLTVPTIHDTGTGGFAQLERDDSVNTATLSRTDANTITIAGTKGDKVLIVSIHNNANFGDENTGVGPDS
jgi:hypothetical protein